MHKRTSADTNGIHVRLENDLLHAIECFRRSEPDIPTRPEAVRRLLQQAMRACQKEVSDKLHRAMPTLVSAKNKHGSRNQRKLMDRG